MKPQFPTIAAETEAIELLKNSKKGGKQKGSGNGGNPSAGSRTGADLESFVELLDSKPTDGLARPDRNTDLSSGNETDSVPSEFRSGLDRLTRRWKKITTDKCSTCYSHYTFGIQGD